MKFEDIHKGFVENIGKYYLKKDLLGKDYLWKLIDIRDKKLIFKCEEGIYKNNPLTLELEFLDIELLNFRELHK